MDIQSDSDLATSLEAALVTAIEQLYNTFAGYPGPSLIVADFYEIREGDPKGILSKPLRALTPDDLASYTAKAMTTCGAEDDYRYFLPRVLDLATLNPPAWLDLAIVLGKLDYGGWRQWARSEQQAVEAFLSAWWRQTLSRFPSNPPIDGLLTGIVRCDKLTRYLNLMSEIGRRSPAARCHLLTLVIGYAEDIFDCVDRGPPFRCELAWWEDRQDSFKEFAIWLLSDETAELVDRATSEAGSAAEVDGEEGEYFGGLWYALRVYRANRRRLFESLGRSRSI